MPVDIADLYDEMVELRRDNIVRAVELIAEHVGDGPVLVHCMAGKDRTGIVVALGPGGDRRAAGVHRRGVRPLRRARPGCAGWR